MLCLPACWRWATPIRGFAPILLAAGGLGAVFLTRFGLAEFVHAYDREELDFWG
jgi:hypothetical protein